MPMEEILRIKPLWHEKRSDVDFAAFPTGLDQRFEDSGFHIYQASFAELASAMMKHWRKMFADGDLWSKAHLNDRMVLVLDHWNRNVPLIPPSFGVMGSEGIVPLDGKHRLKAASILCPDRIPFILYNCDRAHFDESFKPRLLD